MNLIEYQCNKDQHFNQSIIGYCLKSDCQETRQFCQKCSLNSQIHNQCRPYFQDFDQIFNNLQSHLDYLQHQTFFLITKWKVIQNQWVRIYELIGKQQKILQEILNNLRDHKYEDLKSYIPLIIKYQLIFNRDNKLMKFQNGLRLAKKGDIENAIKIYDELIKEDEKYGNSYYQKGLALIKQENINEEQLQEAAFCFNKATKIDSYNYDAYKQRGICLFKLKKYDQSLDCFNSIKKYEIDDEELDIYIGRVLIENEQNDKAINFFDKILNKNIYAYDSYYYKGVQIIIIIGLCLFNLKNYEEAIRQLNKLIDLDPSYIQAYILKGQAQLKLELKNEARESFSQVIQKDSQNLQAYLGKSQTYDNNKDKISIMISAQEANIKSSELNYEIGFALQQEKKYNQAIDQYDKIEYNSLNQNYMDMIYFNKGNYISYNLGLTLYKLKRYEEATDCFIKASYVESKQIEALIYQGQSLQRLQKHKEAIQCFDEILNKGFQSEKIYYNKGKSLYFLGIYIQAVKCFDQALQKCQKLPKVYQLKSMIIYKYFALKQVRLQNTWGKFMKLTNVQKYQRY
ncbi:unnamed protein product [Paramecium primaurelia]|uniref:Tetratricopeptide repeat protein n=1 Tax=Paramecium primaurelia TaxID=5886 RepID=A0A8S1M0C5_PARPR|nr:unnamed protein product [Paramecium primaurelia]